MASHCQDSQRRSWIFWAQESSSRIDQRFPNKLCVAPVLLYETQWAQAALLFWTPNYWLVWMGLGLLRASCWLPFNTQIGIGKFLGRLAHRFAARRRAITRRNLALAFPELSEDERNAMALAHFE